MCTSIADGGRNDLGGMSVTVAEFDLEAGSTTCELN
jgi:hypothetical protein